MKAYIGIKYYEDYRNKHIVDQLSSLLERVGYETICIIRDFEQDQQVKYDPYDLMRLTFKNIDTCDLVVIDLSEKGVGIGIEAGYAFARGIPIITVAQNGSDISETLRGISQKVLLYNDIDNMELFI